MIRLKEPCEHTVSIHAPPVRGATERCDSKRCRCNFQFTLSGWGATYFQFTAHYCHHISILASCVGSDKSAMLHRRSFAVFNSRSPHGERSRLLSLFRTALFFQFSLPALRVTKSICISKAPFYFSIHAPPMGSDFY